LVNAVILSVLIHVSGRSLQHANVVVRDATPGTLAHKMSNYTKITNKVEAAAATVDLSQEVFEISVAAPIQQLSQQQESNKKELSQQQESNKKELQAQMQAQTALMEAKITQLQIQAQSDKKDMTWQLAAGVVVVVAAQVFKDRLPLDAVWQFLVNFLPKP
jgi:RNase adaptor protein for sRNA GlmZ degradation